MKSKKKTVKGMTLVEIIISMFVFAVTALLMVQAGTAINSLTKHSNHVNKKVAIESPLVQNGDKLVQITTTRSGGVATESIDVKNDSLTLAQDNLKFSMTVKGHTVAVRGRSFTAKGAASGKEDAKTDADLHM